MDWRGWVTAVALLAGGITPALAGKLDFEGLHVSRDTREVAQWIARSGDAKGKPFAIVDKKAARLYVFDAKHRLAGATNVLLGQTVGDHTVQGVGERAQAGLVGLNERTTPAGRFESEPGQTLTGERNVWLDYDAAFAIHRLRPGAGHADRLARLASPQASDNRASWGCVVVPVAFYEKVVQSTLGRTRGVVYVLPESRSVDGLLASML